MYARLNPTVKEFSRRWRWVLLPLSIALGVRLIIFVFTQVALRLLLPHTEHDLFTIWVRYDAVWYFNIVQHGYSYPGNPASNVAFFPLYPILIWLGEHLLRPFFGPESLLFASMAISWMAFAAAAVALYRLTLDRFGSQVAMVAVVLLSIFPFGVFFGAPYTESLYLLLAVTAFLAIERQRWWVAGGIALFAGAVRPPGILVGVCVVLAYLLDWYTTRHPLRLDVLSLVLTPLGLFAYMFYCLVRFGDPLAYVHAVEQGWHRGGFTLGGIRQLVSLLTNPKSWIVSGDLNTIIWTLYGFAVVASVVAVYFIFRRVGPVYAFFTLASVAVPLLTNATPISLGRYISVTFPLFMILALALRDRAALRELILTTFSVLLIVSAMLFALTRGIY